MTLLQPCCIIYSREWSSGCTVASLSLNNVEAVPSFVSQDDDDGAGEDVDDGADDDGEDDDVDVDDVDDNIVGPFTQLICDFVSCWHHINEKAG